MSKLQLKKSAGRRKKIIQIEKIKKTIDVLGLGIIPLDYLIAIPQLPDPGGKVDAHTLTIQGGGPIPNAMVALARLGLKTAVIASVGNDDIGRKTISELKKEKVSIDHLIIRRDKHPSDSAYGFIEDGTGRRTIVLCRQQKVLPKDIKTDTLPTPRLIHLDGRDLPACIKLARWAQKVGAEVTFDIGSMRNDVSPIFKFVDHLIVSDDYARGFTGKRSIKQMIKSLTEFCSGTIIVSSGTAGSIGWEDGRFYDQQAYKVTTVDTTGAGDSFHAGYIYGLLNQRSMQARMQLGSAVAALKVQKPGARDGNPTLRQLNLFLKELPAAYA